MKLIITGNYSEPFLDYLRKQIKLYGLSLIDNSRCLKLDHEFNINSKEIITIALSTLELSRSGNTYTISTNKNIKVKGTNLDTLVNMISYGNLTTKGYPLMYNIFEEFSNVIDYFYGRWLNGY